MNVVSVFIYNYMQTYQFHVKIISAENEHGKKQTNIDINFIDDQLIGLNNMNIEQWQQFNDASNATIHENNWNVIQYAVHVCV